MNEHLKSNNLEFGGIPGSTVMVFGLPIAVYYINYACSKVIIFLLYCNYFYQI